MGKYSAGQKKKIAINLIMALGTLVICIVTGVMTLAPQTYDIKQGEISPETITAPNDFVDETATQRKREEAQTNVQALYKINPDISKQVINNIDTDLNAFDEARAYAENAYLEDRKQKQEQEARSASAASPTTDAAASPSPYTAQELDPHKVDWQSFLSEEQLNEIKGMLPGYIDSQDVNTIISMTKSELSDLMSVTERRVQSELDNGITEDFIEYTRPYISSDVVQRLRLTINQETVLTKLLAERLEANMVFDEQKTQEEKDKAAAAVPPVEYKKNQNIVQKGNVVTEEQYELLKQQGLLVSEGTSAQPYYAVIIYVVLMFFMYTVFLAVFNLRLLSDTKKVAILCILTASASILTAVGQAISVMVYPVFLFVLLGAVLLSPKNAMVYSVFLSLLLMSVTSGGQDFLDSQSLIALLSMIIGSFFAICMVKDMRYRSRLITAGVMAAIPGVVIQAMLWLLGRLTMQQMLSNMAIIAGVGLLCGIASIGVLPIIESIFKLTTPTKLLEISTPNSPLLTRLMLEAPGTYHHSMLVANLAEAGCNAVGGFSLLARVGAYYHDVGKMENPMFFTENQRNNFNPHDNFSLKESSAIVKKHVADGVNLLRKYNMPEDIIIICHEHHGNSLTGYFYAKALEEDPDVNREDFQYGGTPPTTKESAIIMLADVVEASVRSMDNPSKEEIETMVLKMIKDKYDEGQLDNAPLDRRDLNKIAQAFSNIFAGVYHQRIKYPEIKIHGAEDGDNVI